MTTTNEPTGDEKMLNEGEVIWCDGETCTAIATRFARDQSGRVVEALCEPCVAEVVNDAHRILVRWDRDPCRCYDD